MFFPDPIDCSKAEGTEKGLVQHACLFDFSKERSTKSVMVYRPRSPAFNSMWMGILPRVSSSTSFRVGIFSPKNRGPEPFACVQPFQILKGKVRNLSHAAGGSLQGVIVNDDNLPVSGQMDVQLDHVATDLHGSFEGSQGVLGCSA